MRLFGTLAVLFLLMGCMLVNVDLLKEKGPYEEVVLEGVGEAKILVMSVEGLVHDRPRREGFGLKEPETLLASIKEQLDLAAEDNNVGAVVLKIDSPGGVVNTCDVIRHELIEFKRKRGIKVVACLMDVAASGGYYIATAADYIVANPSTITGSIGVIALKFDLAGLMEKVGVKEESVKTGDKKDIMSPFRPITSEEKEVVGNILDQMLKRFLARIKEARKEITEQDLRDIADARILTATQAKEFHLVDQVGYLDDALSAARRLAGKDEARVVAYFRPGAYAANIYSKPSPAAAGNVPALRRILGGELSPAVMYLWLP